MLSAVYPLLHQYCKLYEKLLNDLVVTHQTLCKLLSALLCLFSTLATKVNGRCAQVTTTYYCIGVEILVIVCISYASWRTSIGSLVRHSVLFHDSNY